MRLETEERVEVGAQNDVRVLDHGFVRLDAVLGDDLDIARIARVSTGKGNKTPEQDKKFLDYLTRHGHWCYHPDMEVLTVEGWRKWKDLSKTAVFMVPNPSDRSLNPELLDVQRFDFQGELRVFESQRMSYAVTPNHHMYFQAKGGYRNPSRHFEVVRADEMSCWGHFDALSGYRLYDPDVTALDPSWMFVGFYLGDGSKYSSNRVAFRLKKPRKITWLISLLDSLGLDYRMRHASDKAGVVRVSVTTPRWLREVVDLDVRASDKSLAVSLAGLLPEQLEGLYQGLVASDGSVKKDRLQVGFGSTSPRLVTLFQALSAFRGVDAHQHSRLYRTDVPGQSPFMAATAFGGRRTSLESRRQYHSVQGYAGEVVCTTTSTGLLMVRGGPDKFAFVCGNSPFEFPIMRFHVKAPIFVARQWFRHHGTVNEYSQRYSEAISDAYHPEVGRMQTQGTDNRQGSGDPVPAGVARSVLESVSVADKQAHIAYQHGLDMGVSREVARIVLPVSTYTEFYYQWNLRDLMFFLKARLDPHAQFEIRQYAHVIKDYFKESFPWTFEAWKRNVLYARNLTMAEVDVLLATIEEHDPAWRRLQERAVDAGVWRDLRGKITLDVRGDMP